MMAGAIGLSDLQSSSAMTQSRIHAPDRVTSSAQQFESLLLGQWLADAESSFGSAPGGDDDQDSGGDQMKDFGVRQLAGQLTSDGGIGIARMVKQALVRADSPDHGADRSSTALHQAGHVQSGSSAALGYGAEVGR